MAKSYQRHKVTSNYYLLLNMQRPRFIKGKVYVIEGHPHFYQGQDNGIYRFLKWDGKQKYLEEQHLGKVESDCTYKELDKKLEASAEEMLFYKTKYLWYKQRLEKEQNQKRNLANKSETWFSGSRFVQLSGLLTMVITVIVAFIVSPFHESIWVGISTFLTVCIFGLFIALATSWLAHKVERAVNENWKQNTSLPFVLLLFYLPTIWYVLYKILGLF